MSKQCLHCNAPTKNPKFCSMKCSAKFNNSTKNGRKTGRMRLKRICVICESSILRGKFCSNCIHKIKGNDGKYYLPNQIQKQQCITNDTQKYRRIRGHARKIANQLGLLNNCCNCNYSLHVECSHKKSIESFPDDAVITEINNPKNLRGLCRNCHWEYDNGILII